MRLVVAAFAAVAFASASVRGAEPESLTLDDAFARTLESHPDLRVFAPRAAGLQAELERAAFKPAWTVGAELENVPSAELTITLANVLERGGKLAARTAVAQQRVDALASERDARRLDLLAETARRYLAAVAAREQRVIAERDIEQRVRAVAAARRRLEAGASPESVLFMAEAMQARAELDRDRAEQRYESALRHLAALWESGDGRDASHVGSRLRGSDARHSREGGNPASFAVDFVLASVETLAPPPIDNLAYLAGLLDRTPELQQFATEQRLREARVQLAHSESIADLSWSVGVRRMEAGNDVGLVGSISLPLGARHRAQPGIRAAQAELAALEIEREVKSASLRSTLAEAHGRYLVARLEAQRYGDDVLPRLAKAEAAAERAYRAGAISYLEWAQVQAEHTSARRQQLDAALDAQRALIELQRLTGEPFVLGGATTEGIDP